MEDRSIIAHAIENTLTSPNEVDQNMEEANVVDGLFAIARSVHHLARAVESAGGVVSTE